MGETGRCLNTRSGEHTTETDKTTDDKKHFTRQNRKLSLTEQSKSAVADHAVHMNHATDPTGNIKFTYEQESEGTIPFLDTLIVRKPDGTVKLLIYRKATHTDQYLNFNSHHPIHHKLGVIRTLFDRMNTVVTETVDIKEEETKIKKALKLCGYPEWSFKKVKDQIDNKKPKLRSDCGKTS